MKGESWGRRPRSCRWEELRRIGVGAEETQQLALLALRPAPGPS